MDIEYLLCWNNHPTNIMDVLTSFLKREALCDVTLACVAKSYEAHQTILAASSPYFESIFLQNKHPHPIIFLKDVKYYEMEALLDFIYKGKVTVSKHLLPSFLQTATAWQIQGLSFDYSVIDKDDTTEVTNQEITTQRLSLPSRRTRKSSSNCEIEQYNDTQTSTQSDYQDSPNPIPQLHSISPANGDPTVDDMQVSSPTITHNHEGSLRSDSEALQTTSSRNKYQKTSTPIPQLYPISPANRDPTVDDIQVSSPHIKQERDCNWKIDSIYSVLETVQTTSSQSSYEESQTRIPQFNPISRANRDPCVHDMQVSSPDIAHQERDCSLRIYSIRSMLESLQTNSTQSNYQDSQNLPQSHSISSVSGDPNVDDMQMSSPNITQEHECNLRIDSETLQTGGSLSVLAEDTNLGSNYNTTEQSELGNTQPMTLQQGMGDITHDDQSQNVVTKTRLNVEDADGDDIYKQIINLIKKLQTKKIINSNCNSKINVNPVCSEAAPQVNVRVEGSIVNLPKAKNCTKMQVLNQEHVDYNETEDEIMKLNVPVNLEPFTKSDYTDEFNAGSSQVRRPKTTSSVYSKITRNVRDPLPQVNIRLERSVVNLPKEKDCTKMQSQNEEHADYDESEDELIKINLPGNLPPLTKSDYNDQFNAGSSQVRRPKTTSGVHRKTLRVPDPLPTSLLPIRLRWMKNQVVDSICQICKAHVDKHGIETHLLLYHKTQTFCLLCKQTLNGRNLIRHRCAKGKITYYKNKC